MDSVKVDFRIVVPVFNEADTLDAILTRIHQAGYLDRISFVNDASTDSSRAILERWQDLHGVDVLHLERNMRKEGAIREVLEQMDRRGELPPYVFLLDADSFIENSGRPIDEVFCRARDFMVRNDLAGLALRIDALIEGDSNPLQECVYVDYAAVQADNWITAKQQQLWVINGPGGLFRADELLVALRAMTPDFETGDLQISVNLMKRGLRIGFLPSIAVQTTVPSTIPEYFRQRRRWERGTVKVLWNDRSFYGSLFKSFRILALLTVIHLSIYAGIGFLLLVALLNEEAPAVIATNIVLVAGLWYGINLLKMFLNPYVRASRFVWKVPIWAMWNGVVWLFITSVARVFGCIDAIAQLLRKRRERYRTLALPEDARRAREQWRSATSAGFVRRSLAAALLTAVAAVLLVVVLPPSRDATRGIVTVYRWSPATGAQSPIRFKAVVEAQAVIELRTERSGSAKVATSVGFDSCAVFNRRNWQCERSGQRFLMQDGRLSVVGSTGAEISTETRQVNRLTWWARRLVGPPG